MSETDIDEALQHLLAPGQKRSTEIALGHQQHSRVAIIAEPVQPLTMNLHRQTPQITHHSVTMVTELTRDVSQESWATVADLPVPRKKNPNVIHPRDFTIEFRIVLPTQLLLKNIFGRSQIRFKIVWGDGRIKKFLIEIAPDNPRHDQIDQDHDVTRKEFFGFCTTSPLANDSDVTMLPTSLKETGFERETISTCFRNGSAICCGIPMSLSR